MRVFHCRILKKHMVTRRTTNTLKSQKTRKTQSARRKRNFADVVEQGERLGDVWMRIRVQNQLHLSNEAKIRTRDRVELPECRF